MFSFNDASKQFWQNLVGRHTGFTEIKTDNELRTALEIDTVDGDITWPGSVFGAPLSPKVLGAVGDGIADDTVAVQKWMDSPGTEKTLVDGTFKVTSTIVINRPKTKFSSIGAVLVAGGDITPLTVASTAVDSTISCRIDGNLVARGGIDIYAGGCTVENSIVEKVGNPTTSTWNCIGVSVNTHLGVIIRNNTIKNIHGGPGDGTQGNGLGMGRAIAITSSAKNVPAAVPSIVENNFIDTVEGEEGDAITVLFEPTVLNATDYFQKGLVTIKGNVIRNPTKRYVKIQATDCVVHNNKLIYDRTGAIPSNWNAHIQAYRATRIKITNNETEPVSPDFSHISVSQSVDTPMTGVVVNNNIVRVGPGATVDGIYVADVLNSTINNNVVDGSGITANRADNTVVQGNTIMNGVDTLSAITLIGNNSRVRDNSDQLTTRTATRFSVTGTNSVSQGNHPSVDTIAGDYGTYTVTGTTTETTFKQLDAVIAPQRYIVPGKRFKVRVWGQVNTAVTTANGYRIILRIGATLTSEVRIPQTAVVNEDFLVEFEVVCSAAGNNQKVMATTSGLPNWAGSYSTRTLDLTTPAPQSVRISGQPGATTESISIFLIEVFG